MAELKTNVLYYLQSSLCSIYAYNTIHYIVMSIPLEERLLSIPIDKAIRCMLP